MFGIWWLKYAVIGVVALLVLSYIGVLKVENASLRKDLAQETAEFELYKAERVASDVALKSSNAALTLQFKESLIAKNKAIEVAAGEIQKRIKSEKALSDVVLPLVAVELFNDGKAASGAGSEEPPEAKRSDADSGEKVSAHTLADLLATVKVNETLQRYCAESLGEWQEFWKVFELGVIKAGG